MFHTLCAYLHTLSCLDFDMVSDPPRDPPFIWHLRVPSLLHRIKRGAWVDVGPCTPQEMMRSNLRMYKGNNYPVNHRGPLDDDDITVNIIVIVTSLPSNNSTYHIYYYQSTFHPMFAEMSLNNHVHFRNRFSKSFRQIHLTFP